MWNKLAEEIHAENAHWWRDPRSGKSIDRNRSEMFALMHSELSEALEGIRKDAMDDHIPELKSEIVELADFVIRLLDYAGNRDLNLEIDNEFSFMIPSNKAQAINVMHNKLSVACGDEEDEEYFLTSLLHYVLQYCKYYGLDLLDAMERKRAFNRVREDHKAEARLAAGGKKF